MLDLDYVKKLAEGAPPPKNKDCEEVIVELAKEILRLRNN